MEKFIKEFNDTIHEIFVFHPYLFPEQLKKMLFQTKEGSEFNKDYEELFIEMVAYIYSMNHSINDLLDKPLPELNPSVPIDDFISFSNYLRLYKGLPVLPTGEVHIEQDYYDLVKSAIINNVLKDKGYALNITSMDLRNNILYDPVYKLFVPVTNESLYEFASLLLANAEINGLPYDFRVNTDNTHEYGNNIEICVTEDNKDAYINIINNILSDDTFPSIKINTDLMSKAVYPINPNIGIVPVFTEREYQDVICSKVCSIKVNQEKQPFDVLSAFLTDELLKCYRPLRAELGSENRFIEEQNNKATNTSLV